MTDPPLFEAILETVSSTVLFELKDPRIKHVTVTNVEVSPDIRSAKVYVSVMGDEKTQALTMHGLESARGFLQAKVADRIQTRYTPILKFVLDPGVKRSIEASQALREVLPAEESAGPDQTSAELDDVSVALAREQNLASIVATVAVHLQDANIDRTAVEVFHGDGHVMLVVQQRPIHRRGVFPRNFLKLPEFVGRSVEKRNPGV